MIPAATGDCGCSRMVYMSVFAPLPLCLRARTVQTHTYTYTSLPFPTGDN